LRHFCCDIPSQFSVRVFAFRRPILIAESLSRRSNCPEFGIDLGTSHSVIPPSLCLGSSQSPFCDDTDSSQQHSACKMTAWSTGLRVLRLMTAAVWLRHKQGQVVTGGQIVADVDRTSCARGEESTSTRAKSKRIQLSLCGTSIKNVVLTIVYTGRSCSLKKTGR
jgi:hypothetical protein